MPRRRAGPSPGAERCRKCSGAPVRATSPRSRATTAVSASKGWPASPSIEDHCPSCMTPPAASEASSQCWAHVTPRPLAYSRARRIRSPSPTHAPSSVKSVTPSAAISAIGARAVPARPTVSAPATATSQLAPRARARTLGDDRGGIARGRRVGHRDHRGVSAERAGARRGLDRLGLLATRLAQVRVEVHEPRADDAARRVEHRRAAGCVDALGDVGDPSVDDQHVGATRSSWSRRPCRPRRGARTPLTTRRRARVGSPPRTKKRIAMRTATPLRDLARRRASWAPSATDEAISTPRVIGPGWVTTASGLRQTRPPLGEPVRRGVLRERRDVRAAPPLDLQAQQRDDVGLAERVVEVGGDVDGPDLGVSRQQGPGRAQRDRARRACGSAMTSLRATRECRTSPTMSDAQARRRRRRPSPPRRCRAASHSAARTV